MHMYIYICICIRIYGKPSLRGEPFMIWGEERCVGGTRQRPITLLPEHFFRVGGLGFRVQGSGFRVQGSGFRVQGLGHMEKIENQMEAGNIQCLVGLTCNPNYLQLRGNYPLVKKV